MVQAVGWPYFGSYSFVASPAQFDSSQDAYYDWGLIGRSTLASPYKGCTPLVNDVRGRIAIVERGECMFEEKAIVAQNAGAVALIVVG